jgi:hypothetical protein
MIHNKRHSKCLQKILNIFSSSHIERILFYTRSFIIFFPGYRSQPAVRPIIVPFRTTLNEHNNVLRFSLYGDNCHQIKGPRESSSLWNTGKLGSSLHIKRFTSRISYSYLRIIRILLKHVLNRRKYSES